MIASFLSGVTGDMVTAVYMICNAIVSPVIQGYRRGGAVAIIHQFRGDNDDMIEIGFDIIINIINIINNLILI
jgi:hypothetical protein